MSILTEQERLGTLIAGRYRLDGVLGRGGTAIVFDAMHTWTGRRVALKLLRPEYAQDLALVRRFMQEARTAAGLAHPNIVEVLDMGADEGDGTVFLVLELLEGETLSSLLATHTRLPADEAVALLAPVMRALAEAHSHGIVHRDVKPDNVFLARGADGSITPKLLDFGMAKMIESAWGHATQSGTLVGTPFYMSPEQARGASDVGAQSDVWSMGVLLYRAVTGVLPFTGTTPTALLLAIVGEPPAPVASLAPEVPPHIARAIDRALVVDRAVRHPSIDALADGLAGGELAPLPAPGPADSTSAASPTRSTGRAGRHAAPWRALAVGAAFVALAGAVLGLARSEDDTALTTPTLTSAPEMRTTLVASTQRDRDDSPTAVDAPLGTVSLTDAGLTTVALPASTTRTRAPRRTRPATPAPPATTLPTAPSRPPPTTRLPGVTEVW